MHIFLHLKKTRCFGVVEGFEVSYYALILDPPPMQRKVSYLFTVGFYHSRG
jgi:hypothetical protein